MIREVDGVTLIKWAKEVKAREAKVTTPLRKEVMKAAAAVGGLGVLLWIAAVAGMVW